MTRLGNDDVAREKARLLQRDEKPVGLGSRVDDLILAAVDQQELGAVLVDRRVAERRRVKEQLTARRGRRTEKFLGDLVARPVDLVVLPLRLHVVDAVKADRRLDRARYIRVRIATAFGGQQGLIA